VRQNAGHQPLDLIKVAAMVPEAWGMRLVADLTRDRPIPQARPRWQS